MVKSPAYRSWCNVCSNSTNFKVVAEKSKIEKNYGAGSMEGEDLLAELSSLPADEPTKRVACQRCR